MVFVIICNIATELAIAKLPDSAHVIKNVAPLPVILQQTVLTTLLLALSLNA
jgi:hypothetical protein